MNNIGNSKIVLFLLDELCYALFLLTVERVIRAVKITPLPKAPDIILGVINFRGEILPLVDIRDCFRLPRRKRDLEDQFIISHTSKRLVVPAVDSVTGVYKTDTPQIAIVKRAFPYSNFISGIAKIATRIILISQLKKSPPLDEEILFNNALAGETA